MLLKGNYNCESDFYKLRPTVGYIEINAHYIRTNDPDFKVETLYRELFRMLAIKNGNNNKFQIVNLIGNSKSNLFNSTYLNYSYNR